MIFDTLFLTTSIGTGLMIFRLVSMGHDTMGGKFLAWFKITKILQSHLCLNSIFNGIILGNKFDYVCREAYGLGPFRLA